MKNYTFTHEQNTFLCELVGELVYNMYLQIIFTFKYSFGIEIIISASDTHDNKILLLVKKIY
jgi:hypothetical protein